MRWHTVNANAHPGRTVADSVSYLYSGLRTTCHFNTKIFHPDGEKQNLWSSDSLENYGFDDAQLSFYADGCAIDMSEDGASYSIKSATNEASIVNLKVTRKAPGFQAGKDGMSYFGTDPNKPWGSMRHAFWPRCDVEGSIITKAGDIDFKGRAMFIHALQGMKPHHAGLQPQYSNIHAYLLIPAAAAKWKFANFQSPTYSAVMMEYTTPPSYGSSVVNVGGLAQDGKIICAGSSNLASHLEIKTDVDNEWPEPASVNFQWSGMTSDGKPVTAELAGSLGTRLDKVDVMAEVPGFVKAIIGGVVGTKPYIYQVNLSHTRYLLFSLANRTFTVLASTSLETGYQYRRHRNCRRGNTILRGSFHFRVSAFDTLNCIGILSQGVG